MSEPGKYVLLNKVQPSSKKIKKVKQQKNKQLKTKLEKVSPKESKKQISHPKRDNKTKNGKAKGKTLSPGNEMGRDKKKAKQKGLKKQFPHEVQQNTGKNKKQIPKEDSSKEPKTFQDDLSDRLKASRFRFINEQLYTQSGDKANEVFEQDDSAFTTYHAGYRKQVEQWPLNPLDRIIKSIRKL